MTNSEEHSIGKKARYTLIAIWAHVLFLLWLILVSGISIKLKVSAFAFTIAITYLQLVLVQDYYFLKKHINNKNFRQDVRLINSKKGQKNA